jgi:tRNA-binding protein
LTRQKAGKLNPSMASSSTIQYKAFEAIDIRVGTIVSAENFPTARKPAYKLRIDFGPLGMKRSSAQITVLYTTDELEGRQVLAVVNFPPRQVADFISEVLVLGILGEQGAVVLLAPERPLANGSRVFLPIGRTELS